MYFATLMFLPAFNAVFPTPHNAGGEEEGSVSHQNTKSEAMHGMF